MNLPFNQVYDIINLCNNNIFSDFTSTTNCRQNMFFLCVVWMYMNNQTFHLASYIYRILYQFKSFTDIYL